MSKTISIVHGRATGDFARNADVVLYPSVEGFAWDDFHKGYDLMKSGMEECRESLEDIQHMIQTRKTGNAV